MPSGLYFCRFSNASIRLQDKQMVQRMLLEVQLDETVVRGKYEFSNPTLGLIPQKHTVFSFMP